MIIKKEAIIVDIDGTIANKNGRGIHDYHRVSEDTKHEAIMDIIRTYSMAKPLVQFIYVTGRPDSCLVETKEWLWKHGLPVDVLHMRVTGDYRKDFIVKKEIYEAKIKPLYDVLFVLEDRTQVVQMWRAEGLTCLQVAAGDF